MKEITNERIMKYIQMCETFRNGIYPSEEMTTDKEYCEGVKLCGDKYNEYKRTHDFMTSALMAKTEMFNYMFNENYKGGI